MEGLFNSSFAAPAQYSLLPSFLSGHVDQDWAVLQTLSRCVLCCTVLC